MEIFIGETINGDRALRAIVRRLSNQTRNVACPEIERIFLSDGCRITDKGLELLSRRCPELTHLQIQMSFNVSHNALFHLTTKCTNLQHLDVSGELRMSTLRLHYDLLFCQQYFIRFQAVLKLRVLISIITWIHQGDFCYSF